VKNGLALHLRAHTTAVLSRRRKAAGVVPPSGLEDQTCLRLSLLFLLFIVFVLFRLWTLVLFARGPVVFAVPAGSVGFQVSALGRASENRYVVDLTFSISFRLKSSKDKEMESSGFSSLQSSWLTFSTISGLNCSVRPLLQNGVPYCEQCGTELFALVCHL
jgi:hypothetical protein